MCIILKSLSIFVVSVFFSFGIHAQQVTKEQLLKLFYKAQSAMNNGKTETAIDAYIEILKLSPGLPDTYLQLGNIYSTMTTDAVAMEKACICYANYLKLKPETEDAELLKTKISDLTTNVQQLRGGTTRFSTDLLGLVEKTPVLFVGGALAELPKTSVKEENPIVFEEKKDSIVLIVADTVKTMRSLSIDESLLGRWASASLGHGGRENLILDITRTEDTYYFYINDSSFVKNNDKILKNILSEKKQLKFSENEMIVTYVTDQEEHEVNEKVRKDGSFWDDWLNGVGMLSNTSNETAPNNMLINADSIIVEPIIEHSYQFRLAYDGFKLSGFMTYKELRRDTVETLLSEINREYEFFKAPDDYLGFTYKPVITVSEKATKMEFRRLLNQKIQESMDNVMALNDLGCMYASGVGSTRNMKMAFSSFQEASMKNSLYGILNLAQLYVDGVGVERNLDKARTLYQQAFDKGFSDAMVMCGDTYLVSAATADDYKKALDCYLNAVYRRSPYAYYRLAWLYKEGLGIEADSQKALEYYQKAVEMQYPAALMDMGLFYKEGDMVEKDIPKALELLTKAADKGHANAMYELYEIFLRGDEGVEPNFKYAKDWYAKYLKANDKVIDGYNTVKSQINAILAPKR